MNLTNKKILSHEEMRKLTQEEIKDYFSQLKDGWVLEGKIHPVKSVDEVGGVAPSAQQFNRVKKLFKFDDFVKAMEFVNKIAVVAEEEGHHPDIEIHYNKVNIILWTHFINGLSENDFIMAAKINVIN